MTRRAGPFLAVLAVAAVSSLACNMILSDFEVGSGSGAGPSSDPCADRSDCSRCADFDTCTSCEGDNHPDGAAASAAWDECLYCHACYWAYGTTASTCPSPSSRDACDVGGTSGKACMECADQGTCQSEVEACAVSPDCVAYIDALTRCPAN